jgi:hypothetical protein
MATRPVWGPPIGPEMISPKATKTGGFLKEKAALKRSSVYKKNVTKGNMLKVV